MHTHPIAVMMDEPAPEEPRTALGLLSELTVRRSAGAAMPWSSRNLGAYGTYRGGSSSAPA